MTGQGSPRTSIAGLAFGLFWPQTLGWCCALALFFCCSTFAMAVEMRLRLAWGDGEATRWRGSIAVSEGTLADPVPLAIEPDESGSIWLDANTLQIEARSPRRYEGVDVTVDAPLEASLIVRLGAQALGAAREVSIPLRDLREESQTVEIDDRDNRLVARRAPGDSLRVELERDHVVCMPREDFKFQIAPHEIGVSAGTRIEVHCAMRPARGGDVLWEQEFDWTAPAEGVAGEALSVSATLPAAEGAYDLVITARRRSLQRLGLKQTVATRSVQLVVIDPSANVPIAEDAVAPSLLEEIDPAGPKWWERLTTVPLIPGVRKGPLGSGDTRAVRLENLAFVELAANATSNDVSWEAYPLPVKRPGEPHLLEIDFPANVQQNLGISIVEPNAAGAVAPVGIDSGIYVGEAASETAPGVETFKLNFWPRTRTPILFMTNRSAARAAVFGKIRLSEQSARLAPAPPPDTLVPARTWSAYFDRPLWPENFGATEALDVGSGRSLKDWKTFHDGAARLLDYLRHAGRNGLIVPAWSDGCALYPTKLIESTPRYDNGVFFSTAQDPCRKDVLELLFRMCDREGLQLTPMLDFSTPLASLEALRRQAGDNADGLEWVNADGARLAEKEPTYRGQMPYYNVLDERVQAAMAAVVQEFADRYAGHPAFGGVAIPLSAHGYAQLPPPEWGLDSVTLAAFARDTGIQAEPRTLPTRHRDAWLEWRAQRLAEFHGRLARIVAQARPGARLQLCTAHSLEQPRWELELQPNLLRRAGDDQLWLEAGISPSLYSGRDAPLLARPQRFAPTETLDDQALRMELNESAELNRSLANLSNVAVQFFHEPQTLRVHDFEKQSPFKSTYCWLVSQPTPVGAANRQRITHALAALDATSLIDGGWLLPQGQDDALRDVIDAYRALPAARFTSVPGNAQPLVARVYSSQQATYCYLVNDSPWPTEATVNVQAPPGAEFESLAPRRSLPQPRGAGQRGAWCVEMRPYDLVAVRINAPRVAITGVSAKVDPTVTARLKQRLADMRARAGTLPLNTSLDVVKNPGFERIDEDDAPAPGWVVDGDETAVTLDSAAPHGGNTAALIATDRNSVSLIGQAFAAPRLGRVQVSAWLRSADAERDVPLQVVLEGVIDGEQFERRLDCGKVTTHWTERRFVFDDLPWEGVEAVRVRFDMLAAGKLWLDDVTISAPGFSQAEMIELGKLLKLSGDRLAAGQVRDCQQLLDGYWPRFIEQRAALPERPTVDVANRPKPVEATPTGKPGMLDRINKWMPRFMR